MSDCLHIDRRFVGRVDLIEIFFRFCFISSSMSTNSAPTLIANLATAFPSATPGGAMTSTQFSFRGKLSSAHRLQVAKTTLRRLLDALCPSKSSNCFFL